MTSLGTSDTVYWLRLMVDGYSDRARLMAASERWSADPEKREIADLLVQLIDKWDDEVEAAVEEAEEDFEPDWSECPECEGHEQEVETLNDELNDVVEERDDLRVQIAKGHCPRCLPPQPGEDRCPGGLAEE